MEACSLPEGGTRHPLSLLRDEIVSFFEGLGYAWADGPEVESEWFNFDVLNMDSAHAARAADHTYYIADPANAGERSGLVLRAHTSPVQARSMIGGVPPLYKVCVGRVYRPDPLDATHSPVFNQIEGLAVDRGLTMEDLRGTLEQLAKAMFGSGVVTRLRPYHFAYAEPAAEIDVQCMICHGGSASCKTCGGEGWIEWGGCGMVHKNVLANCGIEGSVFSAFSFGMGLERTLMLREGLSDLCEIVDGDIRFAQTARGRSAPVVRAAGLHEVGRALVDLGYTEVMSFPFAAAETATLTLTDPLPGQAPGLRTTLLFGLLETLRRNAERGLQRADIVEQGRVFLRAAEAAVRSGPPLGSRPGRETLCRLDAALPAQPFHVAAVSSRTDDWWRSVEVAAAALQCAGLRARLEPASYAPWLEGRCIALSVEGRVIGHVGQLAPDLLAPYRLPSNTCAMEFDLDAFPSPPANWKFS